MESGTDWLASGEGLRKGDSERLPERLGVGVPLSAPRLPLLTRLRVSREEAETEGQGEAVGREEKLRDWVELAEAVGHWLDCAVARAVAESVASTVPVTLTAEVAVVGARGRVALSVTVADRVTGWEVARGQGLTLKV